MAAGFGGIPDGRYTYVGTAPAAQAGSGLGRVSFDYWKDTLAWAYGGETAVTGTAVLQGDELRFFQGLYISDLPVTDWFGAGPKNTEGYAGDVSGNLQIDFTGGLLSRLRLNSATTNVTAMVSKAITAPVLEISGMTRGQPKLLQSRITLDGSTNGLYLTTQGDVILNHLSIGHDEAGVGLRSDKTGGDTFIVDTVTVDGRVEWRNHGAVLLPLVGRPGVLQTNGQDIVVTGCFVGRVGKDLTLSTGEDKGGNIIIGAELSSGILYGKEGVRPSGEPAVMVLSLGGRLIAGLGDVVIGTNQEGTIVLETVGDIQGSNVTICPRTNGAPSTVGRSIGNICAQGDIVLELGDVNLSNEAAAAIGTLRSAKGSIRVSIGTVNGTVGAIAAPEGSVEAEIQWVDRVGEITGACVSRKIGHGGAKHIPALPLNGSVLFNETKADPIVYTVENEPYIRLRDLAFLLAGTEKQFEIHWFGEGYITLNSGKVYQTVGGELEGSAQESMPAAPARWRIMLDGIEIDVKAYYIGGEHYFRLQDLAGSVGFTLECANETVSIRTPDFDGK